MSMRGCAGGCGAVVEIGIGYPEWQKEGWKHTENGNERPDFWCPSCADNRVVPGAPVIRGRPPREAVVAINGTVVGQFQLQDMYEGMVGGTKEVRLTISVWAKPDEGTR